MEGENKLTGTLEELLRYGFSLMESQPNEAAGVFQQLLQQFPKEPNSLYGLGVLALKQQRLAEAKTYFTDVLTTLPEHLPSLEGLAVIALQQQQWAEAETYLQQRRALEPENAVAYFNLAYCFHQQNRLDEAKQWYEAALARKTDYPACLFNLAEVYRAERQWLKAEALYESALKIAPQYLLAMLQLGTLYEERHMWGAAQQRYLQAQKLDPSNPDLLTSLGILFHKQGNWTKARRYYQEALQLNPQHTVTLYNLALLELLLGEFGAGWVHYRARTRIYPTPLQGSPHLTWWDGKENLAQHSIYILPELSYGEYLQMIRFAEALQARGAEVIAVHDAAMQPILATCPWVSAVIGPEEFAQRTQGYQVLVGDLPYCLEITAETIPDHVPYLDAPADKCAAMQARFANVSGMKVGICWAGSRHFGADAARSMQLAEIKSLFNFTQVTWVNLTSRQDASLGDSFPQVMDVSESLKDFGDTAAVLAQLDLVITVDTAVAHLAGAMHRPCWVLLSRVPDWRWQVNRHDSAWYPGITVFRQKNLGNWNDVVHAVMKALKRKVGAR